MLFLSRYLAGESVSWCKTGWALSVWSEKICKTITVGKGGGWFLSHGQRLERAEQIALLSMLSAKAGVFAALVGVPFQMKLYIGAAQPVLYTDTYLLMFTAAPKGAFLSVKLTPSLCLFPT